VTKIRQEWRAVPYAIGIDVGGTFTDAFLASDAGSVASAKSPSTPPNYSEGILRALEALADGQSLTLEDLLGETAYVSHGTTTTLNALVTGDTGAVGFITTKGHRDSIYIMNIEGRYVGLSADELQDVTRARKPSPLVPRRLAKEVTERIDYKGSVVVPLDEGEVRRAVAELLEEGVESIAVSLLWSFRNNDHELRIRELIHEQAPGMYVGLSCELSPRIREFSRSSTTIMSTAVAPTLRNYLGRLTSELASRSTGTSLLVMQGSGGVISAKEAPNSAITTVGSVLTGGVVGALRLSKHLGHRNVITTDVGGTTFLVGLVVDGVPVYKTTMVLRQHTVNVPGVKVELIGSGGGAIAWLDQGGNLRLGPRSAGAVPGPAAYGTGGVEPTVTDADLMLGILNPASFLGGRKALYPDLARRALAELGKPLGFTAEEAAVAVYSIQNSQTADLLRSVVIGAGYDPRDFVIYAFGGAGPAHAFSYGRELGVSEILVPLGATASAFSAYGLSAADAVVTAEVSDPATFPIGHDVMVANLNSLELQVHKRLAQQNIDFTGITVQFEVDMRYSLQMFEVSVPVSISDVRTPGGVEKVLEDFEARYAKLYGEGSGFREAGVQVITYRARATASLPIKPDLPHLPVGPTEGRPAGTRRVLLDHRLSWQDTAIYDYAFMRPGQQIQGPAVVEAETTTVAVPADAVGYLDDYGNLVMRSALGQ
jgi:N-methylhydantoinase A